MTASSSQRTSTDAARDRAMAVRPMRLDVTIERGENGTARLIVPLRPRKWLGIKPGATRAFELDELGLLVWNHCDGAHTVTQIIDVVAAQSGATPEAAERATRAFLHSLAKRGLIAVSPPRETGTS